MNDTNTSAETMPSMPEDGHDGDAGMVAESLAEWWHESARDLPWRFGRATPWGVLVSEVMSQQTQMSRVCRIGRHGWNVGRMRPRSRMRPKPM